MSKPRIVILGGGVGAVTAAIKLSKPGWQNYFKSITLYQQGWRLGGKGASGRGRHNRIEEHGLHVWFGFYENAFRMLGDCHAELDEIEAGTRGEPQERWPLAFKTIEESFTAAREIGLTDYDGADWKLWIADFFAYDDQDRPWASSDARSPGHDPDQMSMVSYAARALELAADLAASLVRSRPGLEIVASPVAGAQGALADVGQAAEAVGAAVGTDPRGILSAAADAFDTVAARAASDPAARAVLDATMAALEEALGFLRCRYAAVAAIDDDLRRAWYIVDLLIAIVRGMVDDGILDAGSFDAVDDQDFRQWLLAHGASRDTVDCVFVRSLVYDLAFAYRDGDPWQPLASAATALRGMLRVFFTYRGALMWKMNAGMGDVVFAPLYELLFKRDVEVRFFHRVESVRVSDGHVDAIELDLQAPAEELSALKPRDYLLKPEAVWPSEPSRVLPDAACSAAAYESWYLGRDSCQAGTTTLTRGGGKDDDFELVVFGLPISCVENVAADDLKSWPDCWQEAVDRVETVCTEAMQLWLDHEATDLVDSAQNGILTCGFVEPFDTWADMCQVVGQENVPDAKTVAYFCNAFAPTAPPPTRGEAEQWLDAQAELVRAQAVRFLTRHIQSLWPKGVDPTNRHFRWDWLIAPDDERGADRLRSQYLRANVEPSERYVLSLPGTSRFRIQPDATGISNLYAVGDWTACGLNVGCVESAAISGMIAANSIHRACGAWWRVEPIIGLTDS